MRQLQKLRIGLLLCDHVDEQLRNHTGGDYGELFGAFLARAADAHGGVELDVVPYDAVGGQLPERPDECDSWLVTGSRHDAFASDKWILELQAFLRTVVAHRQQLAGICFGHQLIAMALGGTVERTDRWAVGPQHLALDATPWSDAASVFVHAMHRDVVTALPAGAAVIGSGTTSAIPAYRIGDNVLCVQDHPEFPTAYVEALIEGRIDRIGAAVATAALAALATQATQGDVLGSAILAFLADDRSASR